MSQKLFFVVNPISGGRDKDEVMNTIKQWCKSSDVECHFWKTTGKDDVSKLQDELASTAVDKVIAIGGDGTLMLCAQALLHKDMLLGFIPNGSANGMAAELKLPEDTEGLLELMVSGKYIEADMICFNGTDYSLHISDIGLNARLVKHFEEDGTRGFLGYAKGAIRELSQLEKFEVTLYFNEQQVNEQAYMVAFGNGKRYGTGALLNNKGKLNDGLFEVCVLREFSPIGLAGHLWNYIDENADHMKVYQTNHLKLKTHKAVPFQIDGELKNDITELELTIEPACVKLITP